MQINLPADLFDGNTQTPSKNSDEPTKNTINMMIAYPSSPPIENGFGMGGAGGGFGHDASQSTHEHAGVFAYNKSIKINFSVFPRKETKITHIQRFTARSDSRIQRDVVVHRFGTILCQIVDLERNIGIRWVAHVLEPFGGTATGRTPFAAH